MSKNMHDEREVVEHLADPRLVGSKNVAKSLCRLQTCQKNWEKNSDNPQIRFPNLLRFCEKLTRRLEVSISLGSHHRAFGFLSCSDDPKGILGGSFVKMLSEWF